MEKIITLGEKEMKLKSSAATNILFKRAFKEDITVLLQSYTKNMKELQAMQKKIAELRADETLQKEQILEQMNELMQSEVFLKATSFQTDTLPKLAYIMYLEGNETVDKIFSKLNEDQYLFWLMDVDQDELSALTGEVLGIWRTGARSTSKLKNAQS